MHRMLVSLIVVVVAVYALYAGMLYSQQRMILFPGAGVPVRRATLPANGRDVALAASFGNARAIFLATALTPSPAPVPAPVLIYLHGNYEFIDESLGAFRALTDAGLHVLLLEYPGYAGSDGTPSRDSLAEAARLAYDWLAAQPDVDAARIVVFGRSIGTGAATELLRERKPRALILMSPFTSIADFAGERWIPPFLVRDPFDNVARVRDYDGPVLVLHGRRDEIIPFRHGERVAASGARATLVPLDCGHNDCPWLDDPAFVRTITQFLRGSDVL